MSLTERRIDVRAAPGTKADTVVIGAGPAGLGAALALKDGATVLEGRENVAGLCDTVTLDGAVFDLGGHSFHTPHPEIRRLVFDALEMEEQKRDAWCWLNGEWVHYPFQQHFSKLADPTSREACAMGLETASGWQQAANFDEYLDRRFGRGITELFMRPYNRKLWGRDLSRLDADWVSERVAAPTAPLDSNFTGSGRRLPLQKATTVAYPASGGFGEIFRALARKVSDLRLDHRVSAIDPQSRTLRTSSGETLSWRRIVSTLPLPNLLQLLPDVPPSLISAVSTLEALPITLVMVTLHGQHETLRQRVYCPGEDILGHKIVFNHNSSRWLRALPRHGVQVEISELSPSETHTDETRIKSALAGLLRMGVIASTGDVHCTKVFRMRLGYPVPTHTRQDIVALVKNWLGEFNIFTVGRFGEWAYINSDEALYRGYRLGSELAAQ